MPDYNIPMSVAPAQIPTQRLTPVDPNIAGGVQPFKPIDQVGNAQKAMQFQDTAAQFQDNQRQRAEEANDRAILEAAKNNGEDLYSEEGLDKIITGYKNKLSPKSMEGLIKRKQSIAENGIKLRTSLRQEDDEKVAKVYSTMEEAYHDIDRPLQRYDAALKAGVPEAQAVEEFNAAKQAVVTMYKDRKDPATGKPLLPPEKIQQMEAAGIEDWKHNVSEAKWKIEQVKRAMQEKKDEAKIALDDAKAERELALAEKAARDQGSAAKPHYEQKTVEIDGKKVFVNYDSTTGKSFVGGKEVDPDTLGPIEKGGAIGNRESVFNQRIILSANEAVKDLENVAKLPVSASTGLFGSRQSGGSLLEAAKETLVNKMTSEETQKYTTLATGFQRSLAAIESAGLQPSGSLTHQMDAIMFKEGDTQYVKLLKLAQTRQILEAGLETTLSNPRLPEETKTHIRDIMEKAKKIIPFTPSEILDLEARHEKRPKLTLKQLMKEQGAVAPDVAGQAKPKDTPLKNKSGWPLMKDKDGNRAYVGPNGEVEEVK